MWDWRKQQIQEGDAKEKELEFVKTVSRDKAVQEFRTKQADLNQVMTQRHTILHKHKELHVL